MLNNIKMGPKLIGAFLLVAAIAAVIGIIGYSSLKTVAQEYNEIADVQLPSVKDAMEIEASLNAIVIGERGLINNDWFNDTELRNAQFAFIDLNMKTLEEAAKDFETREHGEKEEALWKEYQKAFETWKKDHESLMNLIHQKQRGAAGVDNQILELSLASREEFLKADEIIKELVKVQMDTSKLLGQSADSLAKRSETTMIIIAIVGVLLAIVVGIFLSRSISEPLNRALEMIKEMGRGHLGMRLKMERKDEIGILSNTMDSFADDLQGIIVKTMQQIATGNVEVDTPVKDSQDEIGPALKQMVETLRGLVREMNQLTKAALDGKLDIRGNADLYKGAYKEIVSGVNRTLDAVVVPINEASQVMEKVAAKDLIARMKGEYKGDFARIKEAINTAAENLDKAMQQVAIGAEQVASASVQVSTGAQSLSQGTSEQASSLEEVSSSLQEMSSMTKQNTANAKEAKGVAEQTKESSEKGVESMSRLSSAITKIKASSDSTAKIVKTIDEIAFQTNLLALNAAVEAARAGDAGKGFAVVAEEVRNLAMRSAEAAKNTANLIEEAVKNSENGVGINTEVLKNFQEINERANKVSQVVAEIAAASEQQDQGIGQVNKAVEQMNQVTQQNAANAEESASAAEEMSSQAEEMRSMVAGFKLTASGEFTQALKASSQSGHLLHNIAMGKKGGKAVAGLQPDPRKMIPLDDKDHGILKNF